MDIHFPCKFWRLSARPSRPRAARAGAWRPALDRVSFIMCGNGKWGMGEQVITRLHSIGRRKAKGAKGNLMTFSSCFLMRKPSLPVQDCYSDLTSDVLQGLGRRRCEKKPRSTASCAQGSTASSSQHSSSVPCAPHSCGVSSEARKHHLANLDHTKSWKYLNSKAPERRSQSATLPQWAACGRSRATSHCRTLRPPARPLTTRQFVV